jgi:hypothetical protein
MSIRVIPDEGQPSASIEIPLEKPLPEYCLEQVDQPTPRNVDAILASEGFRELIDDARGVLMDLLAHPPTPLHTPHEQELDLTHADMPLELTQLGGAICPGNDDEVFRPGLWIVLRAPRAKPKTSLPHTVLERIADIGAELAKRLQCD